MTDSPNTMSASIRDRSDRTDRASGESCGSPSFWLSPENFKPGSNEEKGQSARAVKESDSIAVSCCPSSMGTICESSNSKLHISNGLISTGNTKCLAAPGTANSAARVSAASSSGDLIQTFPPAMGSMEKHWQADSVKLTVELKERMTNEMVPPMPLKMSMQRDPATLAVQQTQPAVPPQRLPELAGTINERVHDALTKANRRSHFANNKPVHPRRPETKRGLFSCFS